MVGQSASFLSDNAYSSFSFVLLKLIFCLFSYLFTYLQIRALWIAAVGWQRQIPPCSLYDSPSAVAEGEGVGRSHSVLLPFRFVACLPR